MHSSKPNTSRWELVLEPSQAFLITAFGLALLPESPPVQILAMQKCESFSGLVEFTTGFAPRPGITHVLFDFDGTLSLIRQGWPEVMVPMFVEMLPSLAGESEEAKRALLYEDIMRLNGKQTIYQ